MMTLSQHLTLLERDDRAVALQTAIARTVRPGARVLDAGCGTGILSIWAVRAGAGHVTAVDIDHIDLARALARDNGCERSITFVRCNLGSFARAPGEAPFDVLLAMIYYNDPRRDDGQSALAFDLQDRHLRSGGARIPDHVRYTASAFDWPEQDVAARERDFEARVGSLEARYRLRLGALIQAARASVDPLAFPTRLPSGALACGSARQLGPSAPAWEMDYRNSRTAYPASIALPIATAGSCNAVMWTQELYAGDARLFANESVSWLREPIRVERGVEVVLALDESWRRTNILRPFSGEL